MRIGALVGIMMAILVGVILIPVITSRIGQVTERAATESQPLPGGLAAPLSILLFVFVAVLILGAVAWISGVGASDGGSERRARVREVAVKLVKNPKSLIISVKRASSNWIQYTNNLDEFLGVKTVVDGTIDSLYLDGSRRLLINEDSFDWYIADKDPSRDMFKVVGLHKEDSSKNRVYLLGRNVSTEIPYLVEVPTDFLEAACLDCASYAILKNPRNKDLVGNLV